MSLIHDEIKIFKDQAVQKVQLIEKSKNAYTVEFITFRKEVWLSDILFEVVKC